MDIKVYTINQLKEAIDWLYRCNGSITVKLNDKPMFRCWDRMKPPKACAGHVLTYFKNSLDVNMSRYGYRDNDIKIIIHEPEAAELIADF